MKSQKVFIGSKDTVSIVCPDCLHSITVPAYNLLKKRRFKAMCVCGTVFGVELEGRKKFRKNTALDGYCEKFASAAGNDFPGIHWETASVHYKKPNCVVKNISMTGLGFTVSGPMSFVPNDYVQIQFRLDDSARTLIQRNLLVRFVNGSYIGCMILSDENTDNKITWYLLS